MGFGPIVGFDNDAEAIRVSEENAALREDLAFFQSLMTTGAKAGVLHSLRFQQKSGTVHIQHNTDPEWQIAYQRYFAQLNPSIRAASTGAFAAGSSTTIPLGPKNVGRASVTLNVSV